MGSCNSGFVNNAFHNYTIYFYGDYSLYYDLNGQELEIDSFIHGMRGKVQ